MTKLIFLDTETTGLDIDRHEIWEVAAICRDTEDESNEAGLRDIEYHWFLPVDLSQADLIALNIGKFFDRYDYRDVHQVDEVCEEFMDLSRNAHLVGACVDFDAYRISKLMKENACIAAWNYHLCDIEVMIAGLFQTPPPWKWKESAQKLGINIEDYEVHTALGDARLVRDCYDAVMKYEHPS